MNAQPTNSLDIINTILRQNEELKALYKAKCDEQGSIDRELSDWYHTVEGVEITHISQSHRLMKIGKEILKRRRDNKFELITLKAVIDKVSFSSDQVKNQICNIIKKDKAVRQEIKDRAII